MIIFKFIKYYLRLLTRNLYWLYNCARIKGVSQLKFEFPLIIEGKGRINIGQNSKLSKLVNLGPGEGANISFGKNSKLQPKALIKVMKNCSFTAGIECLIGENSRLYVQSNWRFGDRVEIQTNCSLAAREPNYFGKLLIGDNTHIGDFTIIDLVDDIVIGNDVAIGPNCTLYTHDHDYSNKQLPAWKGGIKSAPIIIENGAWIGSGVTILPGVKIGERCVVAAGSVVTKSLHGESIYGGTPAKIIKGI
ncbi:acyltransferase [Aegicerativicinus sediminis]|uniref:acyltransferase n=1 Tax=Aegicerativicinus sediminis TaxID=2893202 RepID=UPI001E2F76F6|nr:DapH/DapD/GlmU-related protein [Aegicerativicinus sediminis]